MVNKVQLGDTAKIYSGGTPSRSNSAYWAGDTPWVSDKDFKPVEFDGFKIQAGLNSFTLTPKQWIRNTSAIGLISKPGKKGNMRDDANGTQLVCLSNLENLNALFISEGVSQQDRLGRLNKMAIHQMTILTSQARMKLPKTGGANESE